MTWRERWRRWRLKRIRRALGLHAIYVHKNQLEAGDPRWDAAVRKLDRLDAAQRKLVDF